MIRNATFVFVLQTRDVLRIKKTAAAQALRRQEVMRQRTQLALQPLGKRDAEALLAAPPDKWRHQPFGSTLENVLRSIAVQLVTRWQGRGKLCYARIEIGRTHFQTDCHARAIDFSEDVFSEIELRVQTLHAFS